MKTVAASLAAARTGGVDRLDAQLLLAHVLRKPRSWLLANDEASLDQHQQQQMIDFLQRRSAGEPLAYLVGEKEFHGLPLSVSHAVLIPRADTEILVDWALELMQNAVAPKVLDMGTGSGAIALALKHRCPQAYVTALDVSPNALAMATRNALRLKLDVELLLSDWWQAIPDRHFDFIVSNPPYIAEADEHLPALHHEPRLALTSGPDGLCALRHVIGGAPQHLTHGGWLLLEHGHDQASAVRALLQENKFGSVTTRSDLAGHGRCTGGQWQ